MRTLLREIVMKSSRLYLNLPQQALGALTALLVAAGVSTAAFAFSPDRPTYTVAHPASRVVLDSITDNPRIGDERTFFSAADAANTADAAFTHTLAVHDGQEIVLRVYVNNDANANLNGAKLDGSGVAKNTRVRVALPTTSGTNVSVNAYVSADNAQPKQVTDTLTTSSDTKFSLVYESGSATLSNNSVGASGIKLTDNIVKNGTQIGYSKANGILPAWFQYAGMVTLKAKVHVASASTISFTADQSVALTTDTTWAKTVAATPGQKVKYQIAFTNTGTTQLNNVTVSDALPSGVSLVNGSAKLFNATNKNGKTVSNDVTASKGINIGAYSPNANGYVEITATMPAPSKLQCGENDLTNTGKVSASGTDTATTTVVKVTKTCAAPAPAVTTPTAPTTPATPVTPAPTTALTNTGPGSVVALFIGAVTTGTIARYIYISKRLSKH
jgi:uncharacterized repeat protein (TIGR01451 family)